MTPTALTQLDLVEQQFRQVAALLACGDAPQLQTASQALQSLSVDLARLLQMPDQTPPARSHAIRQRVRTVAAGMQMLRDNLARQAAFNQQALQVLVPAAPKSTYAGGTPVYGAVARQGRVHKYLAA